MNESLPNEVYIVESNSGDSWENHPFIVGLRYNHEDALKLAENFNKYNVESFMDFPMTVDYYQEHWYNAVTEDEYGNLTWSKTGGYTPYQWATMYDKMNVLYEEFTEARVTKMEIK